MDLAVPTRSLPAGNAVWVSVAKTNKATDERHRNCFLTLSRGFVLLVVENDTALAKMSFEETHLDNMAGCLTLNHGERMELDNWIEKFQYYRNYPVVGRLVPFLPEKKEWTVEEMAKANSETPEGYATAPIYVAAKGKVFDMSFGGVTFYGPGGPYNKFAGRDASRALAKMSLDAADLDNAAIDDLEDKQIKILDDWVQKFEQAKGYPVVGKLKK